LAAVRPIRPVPPRPREGVYTTDAQSGARVPPKPAALLAAPGHRIENGDPGTVETVETVVPELVASLVLDSCSARDRGVRLRHSTLVARRLALLGREDRSRGGDIGSSAPVV
jgi:hypothetical protein